VRHSHSPIGRRSMGWLERFRAIRDLADERVRQEKARIKPDKKSAESVVDERKRMVKGLTRRVEKVCKEYARGVKGRMKPHRVDDWTKGNFGWRVQADFGGIEVGTWPWVYELSKPRILRGLWLQYLGPRGEPAVSDFRVKGTKLDHYYELGRESANEAGYYYWAQSNTLRAPCFLGYFLPVKDVTDERLAEILEEIGLDLVKRFSRPDFHRIG